VAAEGAVTLGNDLARRPWAALLLGASITVALGWSATGLGIHYEVEDFFSPDTPEGAAFERYRELFGRDDDTALVLLERDEAPTVAAMRAVSDLGKRLAAIEGIDQVITPANVPIAIRDDNGFVGLQPAMREADLAASKTGERNAKNSASARLNLALERFATPLFRNRVLSADRNVWVVAARLGPRYLDSASRRRIEASLAKERPALEAAGFRVRLAGYPIHRVLFARHIGSESKRLVPPAALLIAIVLLVGLRSFSAVVVPLIVAIIALVWTFGVMALLHIDANILAPGLAILVLLVSTTDSIHIAAKWRALVRSGVARKEAAVLSLEALFSACLLTSATTAAVFAGLWLTRIPLIGDFGLGVAVGVHAGFAASMLLAPALFAVLPHRSQTRDSASVETPPDRPSSAPDWLDRLLARIDSWTAHRPGQALAISAVLAISLGFGATMLRVNSPLLADLDADHPVRETNRFIAERLGGVIPLDLVLTKPADSPAIAAYSADRMARIERLTQRLRTFDEVLTVTSPVDVLRSLQPLLRDVPRDDVLAMMPAALLLAGDDLSNWVDGDSHAMRIRCRIANLDTSEAMALFGRIRGAYRDEMGEPAPSGLLNGQGYLGQVINMRIVDHFRWSFVVGLALVLLTMLLAFRSFTWAGFALLANLLPLVAVLGVMGYAGIDVRYTSALALSVAFGLAVDDTIHTLAQIHAKRGEADPIHGAIRAAGPGIVWTSIVLMAGFGVLSTSTFVPNRVLAILLTVTAVAALWGDLVLLPALLRWRTGREPATGGHDEPATGKLLPILVPVRLLSEASRQRMYELFAAFYERTDPARFFRDLDAKDYAIVMRVNGIGPIEGFSTLHVFTVTSDDRRVRVLFSGDTVVAPPYRRQKALKVGFLRFLLGARLRRPGKLYWLLTTKGYKTYLLMTRYFPRSWPRVDLEVPQPVAKMRTELGRNLFGADYDAAAGVAHLEQSADQVKSGHIVIRESDLEDPDIAYFARIHPGHVNGDELVCVAELRWWDIFAGFARAFTRRLVAVRKSPGRMTPGVKPSGAP